MARLCGAVAIIGNQPESLPPNARKVTGEITIGIRKEHRAGRGSIPGTIILLGEIVVEIVGIVLDIVPD
jgi:hypothetical protein